MFFSQRFSASIFSLIEAEGYRGSCSPPLAGREQNKFSLLLGQVQKNHHSSLVELEDDYERGEKSKGDTGLIMDSNKYGDFDTFIAKQRQVHDRKE